MLAGTLMTFKNSLYRLRKKVTLRDGGDYVLN